MIPATPKTEPPPSTQLRKAIFGCFPKLTPYFSFFCGVVLCLFTAELLLRPVFEEKKVIEDGYDIFQPGKESRYFLEGFAVIKWAAHGVRGNGITTNGIRPIMVIGDSYVEALQVDDDGLISTYLEINLRNHSLSNAVFSLGHSGDSMADYVRNAVMYREWFNPAWTVVVLGREDFSEAMERNRSAYFLRDKNSGALFLKSNEPKRALGQGLFGKTFYRLLDDSSLCMLSWIRAHDFLKWWEDEPPLFNASAKTKAKGRYTTELPPVNEQLEALKAAYNGRLTILYRSPGGSPRNLPVKDIMDVQIEETARKLGISFVSLCDAYIGAMALQEMPNGFSNTKPFTGHWNRSGHKLAADTVTPELLRMHKQYDFF
jgi:hypothetical protein